MKRSNRKRLEEILMATGLGSLWSYFEDEGIDDSVVDELTEADLERIGIERMGDRKRIIVAIRETKGWVKPVEAPSSFVGAEMVEVEGGVLPADSEVSEKRVGRFWVGKYAVTWGEWKEVREWAVEKGYEVEEGRGEGEKYPVTNVSWYSAVKWCNARSEKEGLGLVYYVMGGLFEGAEVYRSGADDEIEINREANGYRLPRDGEWEWAGSGGVEGMGYGYSGSNDLGEVGWYRDNSMGQVHEVGMKKANELGMYDMSGNVWEWCFDWWGSAEADRVNRGGSWLSHENIARVSIRYSYDPSLSIISGGFRVVRSSVP
jgi:sulfatase modifying factor 1